jgi:hypothetical protein
MQAAPDAPHIFYEGNTILVRSVAGTPRRPEASLQSFPLEHRHRITVHCTFTRHPEWNFSTPLQETLTVEPAVYSAAHRLLAISDIEGNFDALRDLLLANGVIDTHYSWTFGNGRLVLVGDCMDRGPHVTECLWLLYSLEIKARQQGGYVHLILGNHEIMNMADDLRYVPAKYLANARLLQCDYTLWYKPGTELGRWLATKNVVEKIGPLLFVHGGISSMVNDLQLSIPEMNELCRRRYFTQLLPGHAASYLLMDAPDAPFWYRGYAMGNAAPQQVNDTLQRFAVEHIVIGHTTVNRVTSFFNGKVIDVDTLHANGISEGLLLENGQLFRVDKTGRREALG